MKRFWRYWLSVVATASIVTSASAQQGSVPGEIGSYQSIMNRAGINQGGYELGTAQPRNVTPSQGFGQVMNPPATPVDGHFNSQSTGQTTAREVQGSAVGGGAINGHPGMGGAVYQGSGASCDGSALAGSPAGFFDQCAPSEAAGSSANWVVGARALFFTRSGESPVPLARNGAGGVLLSTANDYGTMPGAEAVLTRRTCNNLGMELRYWGLFPNQQDYTFNGPGLDTYLIGLGDYLVAPGATNVLTYFNSADNLRIYRNNEIHNLEINGLRNGGCYTTLCGKTGTYELLGGFRWFQFNEDYRFAAFNAAALPSQINYDLATQNTLLGFQVGGRTESCVTNRLSLIGGTRVGLFNNYSQATQSISTETGALAYLTSDPTAIYNFSSERNSLAMLGELDLGVAYRFTERMRATVGYRLLGVSGVALAPNQIPRNFTNFGEINRIKSNDSLILGGGFAGLEMCF